MLPSSRLGINVVYSSPYSTSLPQLQSPYLICGFPGSGYIGKIAVDHLIQELDAKHLADIYSTSFPPQVLIKTNGIAELMKNSIFYAEKKPVGTSSSSSCSSNDLLLLTGDSQPGSPESQYALAEQILDIATKFKTQKIFTLGAYITQVFVDKPRIFGTANDIEIVKTFHEQNILTMDNGSVAGIMALLLVLKILGIEGTCLLGETSGYVVDAKASKAVLQCLLSITGIRVDMTGLEKKAKDTEMLIQTLQQEAEKALQSQQPGMPGNRPNNTGYIS